MKNTSFNTRDIKNRCENKLEIKFKGDKHLHGWFYLDNKKTARITVSKGRKFVPPKTYQTMAKQLMLNVAQFDDLLKCPLDRPAYEKIVKKVLLR